MRQAPKLWPPLQPRPGITRLPACCRLCRYRHKRHTFAARVLLRWQAQKQGAAHRLAVLACYLGHNRIAHTYWYLQAFPALLAQAGRHFRPLGK